MKNFRTLDLAIEFYHSCRTLVLPPHLKDQLLRAASSIALNLGEGRAKPTVKDQRRYFYQALGSLRECQTVFRLAAQDCTAEDTLADKLGAHLYCLIRSAG